ncbi:MAG: hypothetical protein EB060_12365, partial [Proteobacteria bacterium]|nr:hypothetical protein [Pseudomonadota bacterium]
MNFIQRLLFLAGAIVAIGIALSIGVTIFAFLLIVGGAAVVYVAARQFLIAKGILNPRPGVPMDIVDPEVTVIDGEFEQIENPMA